MCFIYIYIYIYICICIYIYIYIYRYRDRYRYSYRHSVDRLPAVTAALPVLSLSWISVLLPFSMTLRTVLRFALVANKCI